MKLRTKKIIAREFLMLLTALLIGIIAFIGTYLYNYFKRNEIIKLEKILAEKILAIDSLSWPHNTKNLYDSLVKYQFYHESYAIFKRQYVSSYKIDSLYNSLNSKELYSRSKDEFYNYYFPFGKPSTDIILNEKDILRLQSIVQKMIENEESDQDIKYVIRDFKVKYGRTINISEYSSSDFSSSQEQIIKFNNDVDGLRNKLDICKDEVLSFDDQISFLFGIALISVIPLFFLRYLFYSIRWSIKTLKQKAD